MMTLFGKYEQTPVENGMTLMWRPSDWLARDGGVALEVPDVNGSGHNHADLSI